MKKAVLATMVGAVILVQAPAAFSSSISSLRGDNALDAEAKVFEKAKQIKTKEGIERNWDLQPPSIPHDISKERISLRENTCLKCHSKANYEKEKAPEVGDSHFLDRSGKKLEKISTRRWFCVQCHTPQADLKPLVENTFSTK